MLSVSRAAALVGAWGMQAAISGTAPIYVTDSSPRAQSTYHARFYFSPNGVMLPNTNAEVIFAGRSTSGTALFRVQLRRAAGNYQVNAQIHASSGSYQSTTWYSITNAAHAIEIAWQAAMTGSLGLWLDGSLKQSMSGVANSGDSLAAVRLGPSNGISAGTVGAEYYDAFLSTHTTYIGQ
jgi:hypothetical protein